MDPRVDLYSLPHKALRHALHEAGAALWAGDVAPALEAIDLLAAHGQHEDDFIRPLLVRHVPAVADAVVAQHDELAAMLDRSRRVLEGGHPVDAYRSFHRLIVWNLGHFDEEETVVLPALWAAATDRELGEVFVAFRAAHPEAAELYVRWPQPLTDAERHLVGLGR